MRKSSKIALISISSIIGVLMLAVLAYVLYVMIQYSRIEDNVELETENGQSLILERKDKYTIATYNIGFGAYGHDFSFFMDEGVMNDGTRVVGKYGKSISKEHTKQNTEGAISELGKLNPDFILLQEVDEKSSRTRGIIQTDMIKDSFKDYSYTYCSDFHTAYLLYPFNDPHGKTEAGLVTLSRYRIDSSIRRSYPVPDGFSKFFDLDRCFSIHRIPVNNGKELVLINSHMSAYDKGGVTRAKQLEMLMKTMMEEYDKGNYVIVGGDFNHILGEDFEDAFPSWQQTPGWIAVLDEDLIPKHFEIATAENAMEVPTCRSADIPWEKGVNFTTIVDGFIVSDNISYETMNIDNDFIYSDHQPVLMTFKLK